jgi:ABC-type Zn uptake system ZnuABC Zn-binding protein ZnuA
MVGVRGYRMIESDLSVELEQLVTDFKDIHAYNPTQASALKVRPAK